MFALDIRCHCSITEKNIMLTACLLSDNLHTLVFTLVAMWLQYLLGHQQDRGSYPHSVTYL